MIEIKNFDLTHYNSYRIKATCAKVFFPESEDDILALYQNHDNKIVLGGGYNIILSKEHYAESFIIFDEHFAKVSVTNNYIESQAGQSMLYLSLKALEHSLSGLEIFYDIPSSLGGAVVMNAGAGGWEMKDMLLTVKYFDPRTLLFYEINKCDIGFEYRNSFFQKNPHLIIVNGSLKLDFGEKHVIKNKMETNKQVRFSKQPKEFPNAGSVFKRPPNRFVGPMIDELGLKGFGFGGAKVSEKHGGFIINYNNATGTDILKTIDYVKEKVFKHYDVNLEIEQRII